MIANILNIIYLTDIFYYYATHVFNSYQIRYRKFHLFGEAGFTAPPTPDIATFDTDFGVRFGMITCFDIMFEQPAMTLVNTYGVTDIIFPTAWFSEAPFLTGNFNLFSSYNLPTVV